MRRLLPLAVVAVALVATSCGSNPAGSTSSAGHPPTRAPLPAGPLPSAISKMVCSSKAQGEINEVLGVTATVPTPTWVDHLYSCRYQYSTGSIVLSVKELSSWTATKAYFAMLGDSLGDIGPLGNLGQGAFTTSDGSVVVRKDWKILLVDISSLPAQFGVPPTTRADVADTVSDVILGCWAGD